MSDLRQDGNASSAASRRLSDLGVRAVSALVLAFVAIASVFLGGHVFVVVWMVAALAVVWEWQTIVGGPALRGRIWAGAAAVTLAAVFSRGDQLLFASAILIGAGALLAVLAGRSLRVWAAAGVFYAGVFVLSTISLRLSPWEGVRSILWLFATVWSTDTFAYFGGRLIGGPKIAPRISPSKTWSGTLTGISAGTLVGTFVAVYHLPRAPAFAPVLIVTFLASLLSQAGDALESAIKRRFGVKDSSRLIPGHGGVMDRVDGFVAAAVFAFFVGLARDPHSVASGLFYWG